VAILDLVIVKHSINFKNRFIELVIQAESYNAVYFLNGLELSFLGQPSCNSF